MAADAPTFGDLLRQHRRAQNLTQEALAERASVSARAISDLERGLRTHPYRETAQLLATALHLSGSERAAFLVAAQGSSRSLPAEKARAATTRLPQPLTPLIGREAELAELIDLMRDEQRRLVTLTGPAGVGKTRLAIEAAAALAGDAADGALFIDLAPLAEADQIAAAIVTALGIALQGTLPPLEVAQRALASRQLLLVLDNFEHLLPAAPIVSELLQAAPGVRALVTSRAALRLRGEREIVLPPLPVPAADTWHSLDTLAGCDAIRLFVARARDGQPAFALSDDNAMAVAAICQRLDGLPLAIELAASRIRTLAPDALLSRIELRLPLLTRGARDAPARHQTLQAAIAWSYDLLQPEEQALFRCLAVFSGGWTLEAAETVGSTCGIVDPLDALTTLCEHHLVVRDATGEAPRYRMLETLHEFALDRLVAVGEEAAARQAQLRYLQQLAKENDPDLLDAEFEQRMQRLLPETANLQSAIEWAIDRAPDEALNLLSALGYFWPQPERQAVGIKLHEGVLATGAGEGTLARARVLYQAGWLHGLLGHHLAAAPFLEAARSLAQQLGDRRIDAHAAMCQGSLATAHEAYDEARTLLNEALATSIELDDTLCRLLCYTQLAFVAIDLGDAETAFAEISRLGALVSEQNLPATPRTHYLVNLADAYRLLHRYDEAEQVCHEVLQMPGTVRSDSTAAVQHILACIVLERGEIARAASLVDASLEAFWEIGDHWNTAQVLEGAAMVMAAGGQGIESIRCFAATDDLRAAMPYPAGKSQRATNAAYQEQLRGELGADAFAEAWEVGQRRPLAEAVSDARRLLGEMASASGAAAHS